MQPHDIYSQLQHHKSNLQKLIQTQIQTTQPTLTKNLAFKPVAKPTAQQLLNIMQPKQLQKQLCFKKKKSLSIKELSSQPEPTSFTHRQDTVKKYSNQEKQSIQEKTTSIMTRKFSFNPIQTQNVYPKPKSLQHDTQGLSTFLQKLQMKKYKQKNDNIQQEISIIQENKTHKTNSRAASSLKAEPKNTQKILQQKKISQEKMKLQTGLDFMKKRSSIDKNQVVLNHHQKNNFTKKVDITDIEFQHVIGTGGFGKVWLILFNHKHYALKVMEKKRVFLKKCIPMILNERNYLSILKNNFIVNIQFAFQDELHLYLGLEYVSGGDLRYHLCRRSYFFENQIKFLLACILLGLEYLHFKKMIHRDIKPENLILDQKGYLKITDLGVVKPWKKTGILDTSGTPGYMAPEVLFKKPHFYQSDFFSLGVIGFEMATGERPLQGETREAIKTEFQGNQIKINKNVKCSQECKDFINGCLIFDQNKRLGAKGIFELKQHPWYKDFSWEKLAFRKLISPFIPEVTKQCKEGNNIESDMSDLSDHNESVEITRDAFLNYSYDI